ncbi:ethanolamine ammonia-lyase reactivating factor EutA [Paenibacillus terrigena]|uniref:ethanolamine ammonia-lyase reactivating factor EutA n=1 Tax=Paenibacillus terrigena TaxID=369333 RepID=UPI00036CC787|nr:ethanolamine ammonia-lyase reactivating factor EutA [Paenibacillus terrigena]
MRPGRREEWLTSVGIDVGTSTTKMIVSRLRIARMSSTFALPRYAIVERLIQYESPVITTPLIQDQIDELAIGEWVREQYLVANISPQDVMSGAVIFTGESAGKSNAAPFLQQIAEDSGAFVVATAGSDLEAVLAAKGSGAEAYSRESKDIIVNVDIGGGTANAAYCYRGNVIHTVTYHVGGRLIRLEPDGRVQYVASALEPWLRMNAFQLRAGERCTYDDLRAITAALSRSLLSGLSGAQGLPNGGDPAAELLRIGREKSRHKAPPIYTRLMVSGGIGQWFYAKEASPRSLHEVTVHGDMGPLLASALRESCDQMGIITAVPSQTVRATVLGAGMQSTEVSGSTVYVEDDILPLRNVPIIQLPPLDRTRTYEQWMATFGTFFEQAAKWYGGPSDSIASGEQRSQEMGIALPALQHLSYKAFDKLAEQLAAQFRTHCPHVETLVLVCEQDMAKALGHRLRLLLQGHPKLVCIDQIRVTHGDYVDIGLPVQDRAIPVMVKTLAF